MGVDVHHGRREAPGGRAEAESTGWCSPVGMRPSSIGMLLIGGVVQVVVVLGVVVVILGGTGKSGPGEGMLVTI